jgi:hypothetical protein
MKNIFILPTDQPSRLFKFANELHLDTIPKEYYKKYQLYITSDEEIKDKCYVLSQISIGALYLDGVINTASMLAEGQWKKVILTTDPDLIADGVQAIDDEFLEWFVKNQCCESVEVEKLLLCTYCGGEYCDNLRCRGYKDSVWYEIIIPQQEPKQELLPDFKITKNIFDFVTDLSDTNKEEPKQVNKITCECKRAYINPLSGICSLCWNEKFPDEKDDIKEEDLLKIKQETIEEFPQETPRQELNSLVESWQKRQKEYEDLAEKHRDSEHTYKKYTYKAQATRDCWKELLTFNKTTEGYYDDFKMIGGEKIEEAAKRFWKESKANPIEMAMFGAEWQQQQDVSMIQSYLSANLQNIELLEKSYSEEEVKDLIEDWTKMASGLNMNFPRKKFNNWSEQFIKK